MSPRTAPIAGDARFTTLDSKVNALMAKWGFARKPQEGSTSWVATTKCPNDIFANTTKETIFKLNFYGPGKPIWFGVRKAFAEVVGDLKTIKTWPLEFSAPPQQQVPFVGFVAEDDKATIERVERVLKAIAPHKPEYEIPIQGDVADLDRQFASLGL